MTDSRNYNAARNDLAADMQADFPGLRVQSGSSKFAYGDGARAVAIGQWQKKYGNCSVAVVSIKFGRDPSEARKFLEIPRDVQPSIEVKYFPTVQSVR